MVEIVYTNWYDGVGFLQIGMCDLVLRSYTNSGVRIGNTRGWWWITNSYMRNSIMRNTMISREEEINLLKRYDANSMVANCLRWIGWERKNYESGIKRESSTDQGRRSVSLECIFCLQKWKFENYSEWSTVTCDGRSDRTHNARTLQKWPETNLATTYEFV